MAEPVYRYPNQAAWYARNREAVAAKSAARRAARKARVIAHYGGKCACCGEARLVFLAIDHIDGGGTTHRRSIPTGGGAIHRWLEANGFPAGFRVLCHNCNHAVHFAGVCPHQEENPNA